jgi:hypothetical protein
VVLNPKDAPGKPKGLKFQLEDVRTRNQELKDRQERLQADRLKEKKAAEQIRAKLEQQAGLLKQQYRTLEEREVKLVQAERDAAALVKTTLDEVKGLEVQINGPDGKSGLRGDIKTAHQQRDAKFKEVVQLTDDLHEAVNELKRLRARQVTLAEDLAQAERVLRHFKLSKTTNIDGIPPIVDGLVLAVTGEGNRVLVEVSIGSDDGLLKKHRLRVFRPGRAAYVGDIEVVETYPDKAVCTIDAKTLQSQVRRGDYVTSRAR